MYDHPAITRDTDALWCALRDQLRFAGVDAPDALQRDQDLWAGWYAPELVLSQTCGLPFRARLHDAVTLIGTPDYALPGCPPGYYNSVILMRRDDPRRDPSDWGALRLAYNDALSQSGWAAAMRHAEEFGARFDRFVMTGAHRASAQSVADDRADIAFLDAQTWRLMQRHDQISGALDEIGRTVPTPGLPLIAGIGADRDATADAVKKAIAALAPHNRAALDITGLVQIPVGDYLDQPIPLAPPGTRARGEDE